MALPAVKRALRRIGNRLGLTSNDSAVAPQSGRELPVAWYDQEYVGCEAYEGPYQLSRYYCLWLLIADRIRRDGPRRVLDIGCGAGQLAALLRDQGIEDYVGVDFSQTAIAMAQRQVPKGRFVVADARTTPLYDVLDYDVLICTEVLEHIEDDLVVVARFKPGVRCICTVPSFPYKSHVRHFRDAAEVAARYQDYFRDLDVMTVPSNSSLADRYFLFDGVRNDFQYNPIAWNREAVGDGARTAAPAPLPAPDRACGALGPVGDHALGLGSATGSSCGTGDTVALDDHMEMMNVETRGLLLDVLIGLGELAYRLKGKDKDQIDSVRRLVESAKDQVARERDALKRRLAELGSEVKVLRDELAYLRALEDKFDEEDPQKWGVG
jgi:SAM-dependent methyltransferase